MSKRERPLIALHEDPPLFCEAVAFTAAHTNFASRLMEKAALDSKRRDPSWCGVGSAEFPPAPPASSGRLAPLPARDRMARGTARCILGSIGHALQIRFLAVVLAVACAPATLAQQGDPRLQGRTIEHGISVIEQGDAARRERALDVLGKLSVDGEIAVPRLRALVRQGNRSVRIPALAALGRLGRGAERAVPLALGAIGPAAASAVGKLRALRPSREFPDRALQIIAALEAIGRGAKEALPDIEAPLALEVDPEVEGQGTWWVRGEPEPISPPTPRADPRGDGLFRVSLSTGVGFSGYELELFLGRGSDGSPSIRGAMSYWTCIHPEGPTIDISGRVVLAGGDWGRVERIRGRFELDGHDREQPGHIEEEPARIVGGFDIPNPFRR